MPGPWPTSCRDGGYVDANIVVQNLSGGGGLVGTAYVYGKQG